MNNGGVSRQRNLTARRRREAQFGICAYRLKPPSWSQKRALLGDTGEMETPA